MKRFLPLAMLLGLCLSSPAWGYAEPCQLVAQMADSKVYQQQPMRVASMDASDTLPKALNLSLLEKHGAWYIYQTQEQWFHKDNCAPLNKKVGDKKFEFMPVLLNKQSGHNAVITGTFIIKVYRKSNWERVLKDYAFKVISPLPNPRAMIVDVKPIASYDLLIRALDKDKDVILALPILSEPR